MSKLQALRIDYDGKWKILIERTPKQFIEFFLSELVPKIDFTYPPKLMHQDVAKVIGSKRKKGDLVTDIIMEVRLVDGKKKLLYIHIEVQSSPIYAFGEKMFKPFYRLMDKYDQEVTALALFVGEYLPQDYDHYEYKFGKTLVRYDYPTYIVKNQDKAVLKASKNPYAIAVLACMHLIDTKSKDLYADRLRLKKELADFIFNEGITQAYDHLTISAIADFSLNIMILPENLEEKFINHCQKNYFQMKNTDIISGSTIPIAEAFSKAFFKESYYTMLNKLQEAEKERLGRIAAEKELKEAKLKVEKAIKEAKLKAEKEVKLKAEKTVKDAKLKAEKEAKLKTDKLILQLHYDQGLNSTTIAHLLEEKETYVQTVLSKNKKS